MSLQKPMTSSHFPFIWSLGWQLSPRFRMVAVAFYFSRKQRLFEEKLFSKKDFEDFSKWWDNQFLEFNFYRLTSLLSTVGSDQKDILSNCYFHFVFIFLITFQFFTLQIFFVQKYLMTVAVNFSRKSFPILTDVWQESLDNYLSLKKENFKISCCTGFIPPPPIY